MNEQKSLMDSGNRRHIFVVCGEAGPAEDAKHWVVAGFSSQRRAEKFREVLQEGAGRAYARLRMDRFRYARAELGLGTDGPPDERNYRPAEDPHGMIDFDTRYSVIPSPYNPRPTGRIRRRKVPQGGPQSERGDRGRDLGSGKRFSTEADAGGGVDLVAEGFAEDERS